MIIFVGYQMIRVKIKEFGNLQVNMSLKICPLENPASQKSSITVHQDKPGTGGLKKVKFIF